MLSFLFTSFFGFIVLFHTEYLFLTNCSVFLNCSHSESFMSKGLDLFLITWGDSAEVIYSLIAQERASLLLEFCSDKLSFPSFVY